MKRFLLIFAAILLSLSAFGRENLKVEQLGLAYITTETVQAELKLTATQKNLVKTEFGSYLRQAQKILTDLTKENESQRKSELRRVQDGVSAKVLGSLTPAQRLRLRQLVLQIKGSWALLIPEVKSALKLTPAQEKRIRTCQQEVFNKVAELEKQRQQQLSLIPRPSNRKDEAAVAAYKKKVEDQVAAFRRVDLPTISKYEMDGKAKALEVLTETQRKAWVQMLGPKWNPK